MHGFAIGGAYRACQLRRVVYRLAVYLQYRVVDAQACRGRGAASAAGSARKTDNKHAVGIKFDSERHSARVKHQLARRGRRAFRLRPAERRSGGCAARHQRKADKEKRQCSRDATRASSFPFFIIYNIPHKQMIPFSSGHAPLPYYFARFSIK